LMDLPGDVVFRIHYNDMCMYDPLSLDIDSGGLKLIESDADVHVLYDLAEKHVKVDIKKYAGNMSVEELIALAEEEAKSPYLRSPPLKSRPFRNDMKGKVLFTDMYCVEDEGFEITPPLNDNEVGKEDLLHNVFDLENDIVNDATKILDCISASKNDASKYVKYTERLTDGINEGMDAANNDLDEQVASKGNGISIRENDGQNVVLTDSESDSSDHAYHNSESDSDHSDKSFDYLSHGENELIELRKRMIQSKVNGTEVPNEIHFDEVPHVAGDEGTSVQGHHTILDVDKFGEIDDTDVGLTPLIREHEK
ncbi:hypothetical protein Tco_1037997, partial [Tanacetum coccineum]